MTSIAMPTLHIVKKGELSDAEIDNLRNSNPLIEIVREEEYLKRIDLANKEAVTAFLKELRPLSFSGKLDWYAKRNSQEIVFLGNNPYFQRYWKWHVLMPMKFKRFYYRVKNGEIFRHYQHISDMKKKGPERI